MVKSLHSKIEEIDDKTWFYPCLVFLNYNLEIARTEVRTRKDGEVSYFSVIVVAAN